MADKGKGKLIAGMSGGGEDSHTHSGGDKKVGVVYDKRMQKHKPPKHCEDTPERILVTWTRLKEKGLLDRCKQYSSVMIEDHLVEDVHSKEYATQIRESKLINVDNFFWKDASVWMSKGSSIAAALAAGSLVEVCRRVAEGELDSAFAIVRPPGHHAVSNKAMGFCLYNNVAIAAKFLLKEYKEINKILIVDWDYHHGNGTQDIFWNDRRVLNFSVHGYGKNTYPYTGSVKDIGEGNGKGYTVNVPFRIPFKGKKYGDPDFLAVWEKLLLPIADKFEPNIILISAGFDSARGDSVGKFDVTKVGYSILVEQLLKYAGGKLILALEGGYTVKTLAECVEACITTLLTGKRVVGSPSSSLPRGPKPETLEIIKEVRMQIEQYWFLEPTPVDDSILMEKALVTSPMAACSRGNDSTSTWGVRLKRSKTPIRLKRSKTHIFKRKEKELPESPMAASTRGNNGASSSSRGVRLMRRKRCIFRGPIKFHTYIFKILKEKEPKMQISKKAVILMSEMMNHMMEKILSEVIELKKNANHSTTLRCRDIRFAARLVLSGELAKHAVSEAYKALHKFLGLEDNSNVNLKNY